ncbi:MAG: DUF3375 domain-containing protein [Spirochaetota bacterium]
MDYQHLLHLKETSSAIKLFRMDHFPLIASFFIEVFKHTNRQSIPQEELLEKLQNHLQASKQQDSNSRYTGKPSYYIDNWSQDGLLRKYYPNDSDEPEFELTPDTEKALVWLEELASPKEFVGTESRLLQIFALLRKIVYYAEESIEEKVTRLEQEKQDLEEQIKQLRNGQQTPKDPRQVKENYYELYANAKALLADFRQIEYNFRELNHSIREEQIRTNTSKGKVLDKVFAVQEKLWQSNQGKSFRSFWEWMMSQNKQEEFDTLLRTVHNLPEVKEISQDNFLLKLKVYLIEAGEKVNHSNHILFEQLRKFLDNKESVDNKRIKTLLQEIKQLALRCKKQTPNKDFIGLSERPKLSLHHNRPLWDPTEKHTVANEEIVEGDISKVDAFSLFTQFYVDPQEIEQKIHASLQQQQQISLKDILAKYPVEKGIVEVITYLNAASKNSKAQISSEKQEIVTIHNQHTGKEYQLQLPEVIFVR